MYTLLKQQEQKIAEVAITSGNSAQFDTLAKVQAELVSIINADSSLAFTAAAASTNIELTADVAGTANPTFTATHLDVLNIANKTQAVAFDGVDDNANDVGDYVGVQTDYSVDTLAPTTNTVEVSDVVVTDADTGTGKTLTVDVTYSEDMLTSVNPTIGFDPAVASSLTSTGGSWNGTGTKYTETYSVADGQVDHGNFVGGQVKVTVSGAKDARGNDQKPYTPEGEFVLDTINPTVRMLSLVLLVPKSALITTYNI